MDTIPHFVYELVDPRDNSIFYVGITIDLYERYRQHMRCDGTNVQKNKRIQEIVGSGHLPIMRTRERIETFEQALERELYWIGYYTQQGVHLLNIAGMSSDGSIKVKRANPKPEPSPYVHPWIVALYPICKRGNRPITVEFATDGEFQAWLDRNNIAVKRSEWKFDHRCVVIGRILYAGKTLELADGTILDSRELMRYE